MFRLFSILLLAILFSGCSSKHEEIKIAVNPWIGYSPLFYMNETGELQKLGIKLIHTVSLSNSKDFFIDNNISGIASTQYEYSKIVEFKKEIVPVVLFDHSNGGDIIMTNSNLAELKETKEIDAYLEIDSINIVLLRYFLKGQGIPFEKINLINIDQNKLSRLKLDDMEKPSLLVTYMPYNFHLMKNKFNEIASTRTDKKLLIFDALFITMDALKNDRERFVELKYGIDNAVNVLNDNPEGFYKKIKFYLDNISYEEFKESSDVIEWINENASQEIITGINSNGISTQHLITR